MWCARNLWYEAANMKSVSARYPSRESETSDARDPPEALTLNDPSKQINSLVDVTLGLCELRC